VLEHVVVVTDSLSIDGGSGKVALDSALALAESGKRVTVFAASGRASAELAACANISIVCTEQTYALESSSLLAGAIQGIWNRAAHAKMKRLLATLDPTHTVVHFHGWTKALSSSVIATAISARFPVVITLHEYFTGCPTGCLYLHRDRKVCTLEPMSLACIVKDCDSRSYAFKIYRVVRQLVQRIFGRVPSGIVDFISVSEFSRRIIEPWLPAVRRIHAVDNPVDAEPGPRVRAERNDTFVYVGRLSAEKGGLLLAEAARLAQVKVIFIGDGAERGAILRANPDATVTGWLDRAGVAAHLRTARFAVIPSLWYETLGLVVLEAAALGIPSIVASGTAAGELIVPGETGLTFERGNVADLAARMRESVDAPYVERLSQAAYDRFWQKPPTMTKHVDRLLVAYRDALAAVQQQPSMATQR